MTRSATEAVKAALAQTTNRPGTCQLTTRTWLDAPSAGDRDGDGDADAVDGWLSEPKSARHNDRHPPAGAPVAWSGGRKGYGHRALSLGPNSKGIYMIRTTDGDGEGRVATRALDWVEKTWGLTYLGWSETITGQPIPGLETKPTTPDKKPKPARAGVLRSRLYIAAAKRVTDRAVRRLAKSKDPVLVARHAELVETSNRLARTLARMPKK